MTEFVTSLNTQSTPDITTPSLSASLTEFVVTLNDQSQTPDDTTFHHHPVGSSRVPCAGVFFTSPTWQIHPRLPTRLWIDPPVLPIESHVCEHILNRTKPTNYDDHHRLYIDPLPTLSLKSAFISSSDVPNQDTIKLSHIRSLMFVIFRVYW